MHKKMHHSHKLHRHHKHEAEHHKQRHHHKMAHEHHKDKEHMHHPMMHEHGEHHGGMHHLIGGVVHDDHQQGISRKIVSKGMMEVGQHGSMSGGWKHEHHMKELTPRKG